jgi:hypothetical protein
MEQPWNTMVASDTNQTQKPLPHVFERKSLEQKQKTVYNRKDRGQIFG